MEESGHSPNLHLYSKQSNPSLGFKASNCIISWELIKADIKRHVHYLIFGFLLTWQTKPILFTTSIYWCPSRLLFKAFWTAFIETACLHHSFLHIESNPATGGTVVLFFSLNLQCSEVIEIILLLWGCRSLNTNCCAGIILFCIIPPHQAFMNKSLELNACVIIWVPEKYGTPFALKSNAYILTLLRKSELLIYGSLLNALAFVFLATF